MSKTLRVLSLAILVVGGSIGPAIAQEEAEAPVYVWINTLKAQPGQGDAAVGLLMKDAEDFDPLVESGAALDWGIAIPIVHSGGDNNIRHQWIAFNGWAGADQFMSGFMAKMNAMSDEDKKAMGQEWQATVVDGSHSDSIHLSLHMGEGNPGKASYISLSYFTANPGKRREIMAFYHENVAPLYDKLVADGAILNYGLHTPAVRNGQEWTHMVWTMTENLAALDKESAAFDALMASSPEEAMKWSKARMDLFEPGTEDQILLVTHHKTAAGGGE